MRHKKKQKRKNYLIFGLLILFVIIITNVFYLFRSRYWDSNHSLNVAVGGGEDIYLINLNPESEEITRIKIPGNTEVELSRDLGVMKIKNVWQLGFNEKIKGILLSETITKNFKISTYTWTDSVDISLFRKQKTNLSHGDRVKIALFIRKVKEYKNTDLDLVKTPLLVSTKLNDGEEGYKVTNSVPKVINILASDVRLTSGNLNIKIVDSGSERWVAEKLGEIITSLGGKINLIEVGEKNNNDCVIYSDNKEARIFLSSTFGCVESKLTQDGNFDIIVSIGNSFVKRF